MGCGTGMKCKCCGDIVYNYEYHGCSELTIHKCKRCGKKHCKNCDYSASCKDGCSCETKFQEAPGY